MYTFCPQFKKIPWSSIPETLILNIKESVFFSNVKSNKLSNHPNWICLRLFVRPQARTQPKRLVFFFLLFLEKAEELKQEWCPQFLITDR